MTAHLVDRQDHAPTMPWLDALDTPDSAFFHVVDRRPTHGFYLASTPGGLALQHADAPAGDAGLCLDLISSEAIRRAAGGKQSVLAKAFGLHRHAPGSVLDTTAGLGRDACMLATLGCDVQSLERQPALQALLCDARQRAAMSPAAPDWLTRWPAPILADAQRWIETQLSNRCVFDAIYIDPMFASTRRKAKPQKALAWLAEIAGSDDDAPALLAVARQHARKRVVVKQHGRSAPLAPPDNQVVGKAVRFDIYLTPPDAG